MSQAFFPTQFGMDPSAPGQAPSQAWGASAPSFGAPSPSYGDDEDYDNEPPLLEELGINWHHIKDKTICVLNPVRRNVDAEIIADSDLAGPFVFALLLGSLLLLRGKWTFDYIYGFTALGSLALYFLVNVMGHDSAAEIDFYRTVSILGYCLLPMVLLAGLSLVVSPMTVVGGSLALMCVLWCTWSSTYLFTTPHMSDQKLLVAYPLLLFYVCFALLTIF